MAAQPRPAHRDLCSRQLRALLREAGVHPLSLMALRPVEYFAVMEAADGVDISLGVSTDFKSEMRTLNRDLQLHIVEVAEILVDKSSQYARRVENISLIFKNLYHIMNSLRPHQVGDDDQKLAKGIKLYSITSDNCKKPAALGKPIEEYAKGDKCIVFIQTKRDADLLDQSNPTDPAQTDSYHLFIQI